jgi:transposase
MRKNRTSYTAQEKVIILSEHLFEKIPIFDICEQYEVRPSIFYRWQKQFSEQGARTFEVEKNQYRSKAKKILALGQKFQIKNEVLTELMEVIKELKDKLKYTLTHKKTDLDLGSASMLLRWTNSNVEKI